MFARELFAAGFQALKELPRKGKDDRDQDIYENIYGSDSCDLETDLLSTLDGWIEDLDER